jgi:hypothetical protein
MKTMTVATVAGGLVAASIPLAGSASAYCYDPDCVPYAARTVVQGAVWAPASPLIGVPVQCDDVGGGALTWAHRADTPG